MKRIEGLLDSEVLDAHFRLFAAMISGAAQAEYETGELPKRGQMIFPAQCWKDVVCAKVLSRVWPLVSPLLLPSPSPSVWVKA